MNTFIKSAVLSVALAATLVGCGTMRGGSGFVLCPCHDLWLVNGMARTIEIEGDYIPKLTLKPGETYKKILYGPYNNRSGSTQATYVAFGLDSKGVRTGEVATKTFSLSHHRNQDHTWTVKYLY